MQIRDTSYVLQDTKLPDEALPRRDGDGFDPSIKLLLRIMKVILEHNFIGRTALAQKANVSYDRLSKHLEWLQQKSFVELFIDDGKIYVRLNAIGTEFAFRLSSLTDDRKFGLE
jgi:predicted transcriptional regulator